VICSPTSGRFHARAHGREIRAVKSFGVDARHLLIDARENRVQADLFRLRKRDGQQSDENQTSHCHDAVRVQSSEWKSTHSLLIMKKLNAALLHVSTVGGEAAPTTDERHAHVGSSKILTPQCRCQRHVGRAQTLAAIAAATPLGSATQVIRLRIAWSLQSR
jgi:hypothetical protein